ncbi:MAG TPA: hypothetical protein VGX37_11415 [Allosphingosinicella sp.]|jgi:hypothetical protein|nr:hypothetical protein [Allosphingosinicella sp.]
MKGSARRTLFALAAAAAALTTACGQKESSLEYQIAAAIHQISPQLPMRVDDVTTLTAITHEGTNIIYAMAIDQDLPASEIENARSQMQVSNQTALCAQEMTLRLIRMGATMTHRYTDKSGDRFETRVASCPNA